MSDKSQPLKPVEVRIKADPASVTVVRSAVRSAATLAGMGEAEIDSVNLALSEALTNVIRHSYGGACDEEIVVTITYREEGDGALEFIVRDFGKQVDPGAIKSRDLDDVRPGGLGVHIIQSVMDEVSYACAPDKGMVLRMVKRLGGGQDDEGASDGGAQAQASRPSSSRNR